MGLVFHWIEIILWDRLEIQNQIVSTEIYSIKNDFIFALLVTDPLNIDNEYGKGTMLIGAMVEKYKK